VLALVASLAMYVACGANACSEESLLAVQHVEDPAFGPGTAVTPAPRVDLGIEPQQPATVAPLDALAAPPMVSPLDATSDYDSNDPWHGMPQTTPASWISGPYFRAGAVFGVGGGVLENMKPGYTIAGGYRQPLGPEIAGDRVFLDLGGSYQSMFGQNTQFIPERVITSIAGTVINVVTIDTSRTATLHELREGALNAALGWYWGDPVDNRADDPQLRFATRVGGRVGHARGRFTEEQLTVNLGANESLLTSPYVKKDTFGGVFIANEAILLNRDYAIGHVQWTIESQYTNDWINIGGRWQGSLGTISLASGFMLSW
jgi:hypothetical protein